MIDASAVFDVVDRLAALAPLRAQAVTQATGMAFEQDAERSNVAKIVCTGGASPDGMFSGGVLQYPASAVWGTAGLLELTLDASLAIAEADVVARYGDDNRIIAPTISQPPGSPFTLQYMRPDLRLSFVLRASDLRVEKVQLVERGSDE